MPNRYPPLALLTAFLLLGLVAPGTIFADHDVAAQKPEVITPPSIYTNPIWAKRADMYRPNLERLQADLFRAFPGGQLRFLTANQASTAGLGFWPKPFGDEQQSRYLGVFAIVDCPPRRGDIAFPDTDAGNLLRLIDGYGKLTIKYMAREIRTINDPGLTGGVMIFIHCRQDKTEYGDDPKSQAYAVYIPKEPLLQFADLRMTVQALIGQSTVLPIFRGPSEIENLRLYVIHP